MKIQDDGEIVMEEWELAYYRHQVHVAHPGDYSTWLQKLHGRFIDPAKVQRQLKTPGATAFKRGYKAGQRAEHRLRDKLED